MVNKKRKPRKKSKLETIFFLFLIFYVTQYILYAKNVLNIFGTVEVATTDLIMVTDSLASFSTTNIISSVSRPLMEETVIRYYKKHFNYRPPTIHYDPTLQKNLCGSGPQYSKFYSLEKGLQRSKKDEDKIIYETFFKFTTNTSSVNASLTYVEVGAFDGIEAANSRFYDSCLGWEGLLIEGNSAPEAYGKLISNRPHAHRMNFVPVCSFYEEMLKHKTIRFHDRNWSYVNHLEEVHNEEGGKNDYEKEKDLIDESIASCGWLNQVIRDVFPNGRVTFFSLDMEGSEQLVLEKLEFNNIFVEIFAVSYGSSFSYSKMKSNEILYNAGYERFANKIVKTDVFIHKKSTHFLAMAKRGDWTDLSQTESVPATARIRDELRIKYYEKKYNYHYPSKMLQESQLQYELCGLGPKYNKFFSLKPRVQRSSSDDDRIIYEALLQDMEKPYYGGTYVEVGAFDGIEASNSRFYDSCLGWEGLLIEGNSSPLVYGKLIKKRPYAHRMNFVPICDIQEETEKDTTIRFHDRKWSNAGVVLDSQEHDVYVGRGGETIQVPCGSLTQVLNDVFPDGKITFFSLDVVGTENLILEKLEFDTLSIKIFVVNFEKRNVVARERSGQILHDAGYERFDNVIRQSDVYIHKGSTHLIAKAQIADWKPYSVKSDTGKALVSTIQLKDVRIIDYYKEHFNYYPPSIEIYDSSLQNDLCGSTPQYDKFFSLEKRIDRAEEDEDKIIYETFFKSFAFVKKLTYVEVGAFDGIEASNSRFYDSCLGWEGLLIEGNPSPDVYGKLISNRPYAHRMNFIPVCDLQEETANHATRPFHNRKLPNAGIAEEGLATTYEGQGNTVDVPCGSLTKVLGDVFHGKVTFFLFRCGRIRALGVRKIGI